MSHGLIRKAFNDIVRAYGVSKGYQVILENSAKTPTLDRPYLKTYLMPAGTTTQTLGGDHKKYYGVYQITIVVPAGEGQGRVTTITDELQDLFPIFGRVAYDSANPTHKVVINSPINTLRGDAEAGAYYTPVSFQYRSDIN